MNEDTTKTMTEADYKAFHEKYKRELTAADIAQYFEENIETTSLKDVIEEMRSRFPTDSSSKVTS
jgi:penicillin V acylase-like amidase (Ntn superfamily)